MWNLKYKKNEDTWGQSAIYILSTLDIFSVLPEVKWLSSTKLSRKICQNWILQHLREGIWTVNTVWPSDAIWQHRTWSTIIWVMNGLMPDSIEPLPDKMLTHHHWSFGPFTWGQLHRKISRYPSLIWNYQIKITDASPRYQWVKCDLKDCNHVDIYIFWWHEPSLVEVIIYWPFEKVLSNIDC